MNKMGMGRRQFLMRGVAGAATYLVGSGIGYLGARSEYGSETIRLESEHAEELSKLSSKLSQAEKQVGNIASQLRDSQAQLAIWDAFILRFKDRIQVEYRGDFPYEKIRPNLGHGQAWALEMIAKHIAEVDLDTVFAIIHSLNLALTRWTGSSSSGGAHLRGDHLTGFSEATIQDDRRTLQIYFAYSLFPWKDDEALQAAVAQVGAQYSDKLKILKANYYSL